MRFQCIVGKSNELPAPSGYTDGVALSLLLSPGILLRLHLRRSIHELKCRARSRNGII